VAKIFVSYRRDDASSEAGRITDWLDRRFGEDEVFMDINALEPGVDFVEGIEQAVETIDALIAVIGPGWVDALDEDGNRRLDDPADWVRQEIANALGRGIRVIPVLVKGAAMPPAVKLPDDLKPLRRRNALPITERQWRAGVEELIEALDGVVTPAPQPPPPTTTTQGAQPSPPTLPAYPAWTVLGAPVGAAMTLSGVVIHGSNDTFLHPSFGGPVNFHDSDLLWRLAGVFTTLPTLGIAATAFVAWLVSRRNPQSHAACAGAILLCGLQGVALYAGVLAADHRSGFAIALVGSLVLCAVALPVVSRFAGGASDRFSPPLGLATRTTAVLGVVVMVSGMIVDFNNGGPAPEHVNAASVLGGRPERWDLLVIAGVAVIIGLLAPSLRAPRSLLAGTLVACGIGAVCMWPRFFAIPLIENRSISSPGAGGFIGVAGAALILFSGWRAVRASQPLEILGQVAALDDPQRISSVRMP
jgi:TIR domain